MEYIKKCPQGFPVKIYLSDGKTKKKKYIHLKIYTPFSMKSKIREHLKKIGDNSEQTQLQALFVSD